MDDLQTLLTDDSEEETISEERKARIEKNIIERKQMYEWYLDHKEYFYEDEDGDLWYDENYADIIPENIKEYLAILKKLSKDCLLYGKLIG